MGVIEVKNFTKDYGSGRGVFDISFSVKSGEVFGFLGPNGAGKSTTIRHLLGFSKPDSGTTQIFGLNTFDNYYKIMSRVGYIPGEIALPAGLTGWEFIRMVQDLQHVHNNERLQELLQIFDLQDNVLKGETKHMSLGVKRKLAVVTAFMGDPDVLILDEPTSGLDPVMQEAFIDLIKKEKRRGKTILLSSHIFSEVDASCDRIAIIKDGKIVSEFNADDLKHSTKKFYEISLPSMAEYNRLSEDCAKWNFVSVVKQDAGKHSITICTSDDFINQVVDKLANYNISEFTNIKETLEDYFMKFYKEDKEYATV